MAELRRTPATPDDAAGATYPTFAEVAASRRRFLKMMALTSAAATLGFQLTGCPGTGGGGGGGGGTAVGGGSDWIPWDQDHPPLAGEPVMVMGAPVGVVVGGGPLTVTFQDGVKAEIVVAAVVTPYEGFDVAADFGRKQAQQKAIVEKTAAAHGSNALSEAAAQDAFEAELLEAINATVSGGYLEEVSAAQRAEDPPQPAQETPSGAQQEAREPEPAPSEPMEEEAAAPMDDAAPASDPAAAAPRRGPKARRFWTTCRKPGCKTCG